MMSSPLAAISAAVFLGLLALLLRRLRLDRGTAAIILAGQVLYLLYLGYTEYTERNYDGDVQLTYIEYIAKHRSLPPASHCLICYHPPLYYLLGAGVHSLFKVTGLAPPIVGLQLFSLLLFLVFILFGVLAARRLLRRRGPLRLAAALIVLWPYSVHNSVRVHNDTLLYALSAIGMYLLVRWWQERRPWHLYLCALISALAALTKSSGYVLPAVLFAAVLLRLPSSRDKVRFLGRAAVAVALVAAAPVWTSLGRPAEPPKKGGLCEKVLGNAPCKVVGSHRMDNRPYNYVFVDVPGFVKEPYAFAHRDEGGRHFFLTHLLKSSLFGTHNTTADPETAYRLNRRVAIAMSVLLLGMSAYLAAAGAFVRRRALCRYGVMLLFALALVGSGVGFRMLAPLAHHQDFRHIFAVLVPIAVLYAAAVGYFQRTRPALARIGYTLSIPFLALSVFYFLPKYDLVMRWTTTVVQAKLSDHGRVAKETTPWDRKGNLVMEGNQLVELAVSGEETVREVDISLDSNDRYELTLLAGQETRRLVLGPSPRGKPGLACYVERIEPPLPGVQRIRLRPLSGDKSYSMGHLVIR